MGYSATPSRYTEIFWTPKSFESYKSHLISMKMWSIEVEFLKKNPELLVLAVDYNTINQNSDYRWHMACLT